LIEIYIYFWRGKLSTCLLSVALACPQIRKQGQRQRADACANKSYSTDTGLSEAKAIAKCPVLSIGQSSFVLAALRPGSAAVITTVEDAVPVIQQNIVQQGMAFSVTQVLAARVPVLTLENDPEAAAEAFYRAAEGLDEGISTVILGCAGAVTISERINGVLSQKILDGVTSAARLARAVIA